MKVINKINIDKKIISLIVKKKTKIIKMGEIVKK